MMTALMPLCVVENFNVQVIANAETKVPVIQTLDNVNVLKDVLELIVLCVKKQGVSILNGITISFFRLRKFQI